MYCPWTGLCASTGEKKEIIHNNDDAFVNVTHAPPTELIGFGRLFFVHGRPVYTRARIYIYIVLLLLLSLYFFPTPTRNPPTTTTTGVPPNDGPEKLFRYAFDGITGRILLPRSLRRGDHTRARMFGLDGRHRLKYAFTRHRAVPPIWYTNIYVFRRRNGSK